MVLVLFLFTQRGGVPRFGQHVLHNRFNRQGGGGSEGQGALLHDFS